MSKGSAVRSPRWSIQNTQKHAHAIGMFLAFLCLITQLASVLHLPSVEHFCCSDRGHGDRVHVEHLGESHPDQLWLALLSDLSFFEGGTECLESEGEPTQEACDHCCACCDRRPSLKAESGSELVASCGYHEGLFGRGQKISFSGRTAYRWAPKNSPPAQTYR